MWPSDIGHPAARTAACQDNPIIHGAPIMASARTGRHATMTAAVKVQGLCLQAFLVGTLAIASVVSPVRAQSLLVEPLENGTELVLVAQPMAEVTTVAWPDEAAAEPPGTTVTSGSITLLADLEKALAGIGDTAPAVVLAVGGAPAADLERALRRLLGGKPVAAVEAGPPRTVGEGRIERRLGVPGGDALLRLEVNLPAPSDPLRTPLEVLWEMLPDLLDSDLAGLRTRIDRGIGVLEARIDAAGQRVTLDRLRLDLAQIASAPQLDEADVTAAVERVSVRRGAVLEHHPESALHLLDLWNQGGSDAVRDFLFAAEGVTVDSVREAARSWLPKHPGTIVISLPPNAINPRFATPPSTVRLDSGLTASILERPGTELAAVCLRPVVVPDLDGNTAAAILTRVAGDLRSGPQRPGWVEVSTEPPQLELAGPPDGFAELLEALRRAVVAVAEDQRAIAYSDGDSRRRALQLMAALLGTAEGTELSPATLLRADNLGLGIVAPDEESAAEALEKFWGVASTVQQPVVSPLAAVPKTRAAVAGSSSTLVAAIPLPASRNEALMHVVTEVLEARVNGIWSDGLSKVLQPFIPGRNVLLVAVTRAGGLNDLEAEVEGQWSSLLAAVNEDELTAARRRAAVSEATLWSGTSGRARRCAAVAAGAALWRPATELEMAILSVSGEEVDSVLAGVTSWQELLTAGAGVLPMMEQDGEHATIER